MSTFASADCIDQGHPQRAEIEAFITAVYRRRYGAELDAFLPLLLAFRDAAGTLVAAVGMRRASAGRLFVESYLHLPAERVIAAHARAAVRRAALVEIGNFAALTPGAARELIATLIPLLQGAELRWVVWVATRQLRNAFERLALTTHSLGPANPERLGAAANRWGSYYAAKPELLYGDLGSVTRPRRAAVDGFSPALRQCASPS